MEAASARTDRYEKPELTPERKDFYARLDKKNVAPLWEVLAKIIPPTPAPETVPVIWRYDEVRPLMRRHGLASLFVGEFGMPAAVGQAPAVPAADST